jgi:predicted ATP-dependent endonuclease of OLD family
MGNFTKHQLPYWRYLEFLDFFSLLARDVPAVQLQPVFLYFSSHRNIEPSDFEVALANQDYWQVQSKVLTATSRTGAQSAAQLGIRHFASKLRRLEHQSNNARKHFREDAEVLLVTRYLERLGYSWDLHLLDPNANRYRLSLRDGSGREQDIAGRSFGQKELLNFLLGLFALNVHDGTIIIDEPELHLHPTWQKLLLELIIEIKQERDNQFILATHSATFITPDSVGSVRRVANLNSETKVFHVDRSSLPSIRHLMQIINSHQNERIFFADFIIMVEGIMDRTVMCSLLNEYIDRRLSKATIEVLDVGGKHFFEKYREILNQLGCHNSIIADRDYAKTIGTQAVKNLFVVDYQKIGKDVLGNPKSSDGASVAREIRKAIDDKDVSKLQELYEYIEARQTTIKANLSKDELEILNQFRGQKEQDGIYILGLGAIEQHLPTSWHSIDRVIELVEREDRFDIWRSENPLGLLELGRVIKSLLASASIPILDSTPCSGLQSS